MATIVSSRNKKVPEFMFNIVTHVLGPKPSIVYTKYCCGLCEVGGFTQIAQKDFVATYKRNYKYQVDKYNASYNQSISPICILSNDEIVNQYIQASTKILTPNLFKDCYLYYAVLIEKQKWIEPYLKKAGFELISDEVVNGNTSNRLFFYLRKPQGSKLVKPTERMFK